MLFVPLVNAIRKEGVAKERVLGKADKAFSKLFLADLVEYSFNAWGNK